MKNGKGWLRKMVKKLFDIIGGLKLDLTNEVRAQVQMQDAFDGVVEYKREVWLNKKDKIDFLFGRIGIEVKIKSSLSKTSIYRQCERYCLSGELDVLILVTGKLYGFVPFME